MVYRTFHHIGCGLHQIRSRRMVMWTYKSKWHHNCHSIPPHNEHNAHHRHRHNNIYFQCFMWFCVVRRWIIAHIFWWSLCAQYVPSYIKSFKYLFYCLNFIYISYFFQLLYLLNTIEQYISWIWCYSIGIGTSGQYEEINNWNSQ